MFSVLAGMGGWGWFFFTLVQYEKMRFKIFILQAEQEKYEHSILSVKAMCAP